MYIINTFKTTVCIGASNASYLAEPLRGNYNASSAAAGGALLFLALRPKKRKNYTLLFKVFI